MCYVIRDSSKPFTLAEDMLRNGRNPIISGEELKRQPGILSIREVKLQQQQQLKQKKRNNFVRNTVFLPLHSHPVGQHGAQRSDL